MNLEIKALWLEALESGKYQQGTGTLAKTDEAGVIRHCCLGVLCEVMGVEREEEAPGLGFSYDGHIGFPSYRVHEEAALEEIHSSELASMNDNGFSFHEIAAHIRQKF